MWGGRFDDEPDAGFMDFSASIGFDVRLYPYDIECTRAWAASLESAGVMTQAELEAVAGALDAVKAEMDSGAFELKPGDEDVHTAVERRLVEIAGTVGGKVRTGRSRNDQVATDMRLFALDQCSRIRSEVKALQTALVNSAEASVDVAVPGHTHLQQAQPVLLAHVILAFVQMLERDLALLAAARQAADSLALGSGALAGAGIELDRTALAGRLGFTRVSANSMDAVSDRDFVCDLIYAMSMMMVHLSRLAEQVVMWTSNEWGLAFLHDTWSTGSSLMPQKKNPDAAELVRGKTGRVAGSLTAMLMTLKGLPLSYNRDLQEDKEALFDAVDTTSGCIAAMKGTIETLSFDRERAAELVSGGYMTATDLADFLVTKGVEFPEAHRVVGEVVAHCLAEGKPLDALSPDELAGFSELLEPEALEWLTAEASIARKVSTGGTAPSAVLRQISEAWAAIYSD
ncbi:MAG: argininosuccinate lyase [Candidatus Geothermincolia bacterium]